MRSNLNDMRLICFLGQKGGVGKSTLARVLAVAAARRGRRVLLADFDLEQLTCLEWNAARTSEGVEPAIETRSFKSLKKLRKNVEGYDIIICDTRGFADELTSDVAEESDVVFLPTGTSNDDLRPTLALAHRLAEKGAGDKIMIVLSKTGRSERHMHDALEQIAAAGFEVSSAVWPLKEGYQNDLDVGRAGSEASNPFLKAAAEAIEKAMLDRSDRG
jgi:chromosome partitioning protein